MTKPFVSRNCVILQHHVLGVLFILISKLGFALSVRGSSKTALHVPHRGSSAFSCVVATLKHRGKAPLSRSIFYIGYHTTGRRSFWCPRLCFAATSTGAWRLNLCRTQPAVCHFP